MTDRDNSRGAAAFGILEIQTWTHDCLDDQYGRRVEIDRTWTVYHVFTGIPADIGDGAMTGLSRTEATDRMLALNRLSSRRWMERVTLNPPPIDLIELRRIVS